MNAPFPANPDVGQQFGDWCWNGARWVPAQATAQSVNTVVFTASGPYSPSAGLVSVVVECIGGGGGGGAVGASTSVQQVLVAGGGGSGGLSRKTLPAALVAGGVNVTVGAGGQGGPQGSPASNGGNGQPTSFGALCVANGGGGGGAFEINVSGGPAGVEAAPGTGDVAFPGACGEAGFFDNYATPVSTSVQGARGGWIYGGTAATQALPNGFALGSASAPNTGAGGGGAVINQMGAGSTTSGGAGGSGICIVTEYIAQDYIPPEEGWVNVNARVAVTQVPWRGPGPCPPGYYDNPQVTYDGDD